MSCDINTFKDEDSWASACEALESGEGCNPASLEDCKFISNVCSMPWDCEHMGYPQKQRKQRDITIGGTNINTTEIILSSIIFILLIVIIIMVFRKH